MAMSELFADDTVKAKKLMLSRYRDEIKDIRTSAYRLIAMAAELKRPHAELEHITALVKGFSEGNWYSLKHELEELHKRANRDD